MSIVNCVIFGITPYGKYALCGVEDGGPRMGFYREDEICESSIEGIFLDSGYIDMKTRPNWQKAILNIVKDDLVLISSAPMSGSVSEEDGEFVSGINYLKYPFTWGQYVNSPKLNVKNITKIWTEKVYIEVRVKAPVEVYDDEEEKVNPYWTSAGELFPKTEKYGDESWDFDPNMLMEFLKRYDIVEYHNGYNLDLPITAFLETGLDLIRFSNPDNSYSFFAKYGARNPESLFSWPLFVNPVCWRSKSGRIYVTVTPNMSDEEVDDMVGVAYGVLPREYHKLFIQVLGEDANWNEDGRCLVMFSLDELEDE